MSAFESVLKLANQWQCQPLPNELAYRDSLIEHLREHLSGVKRIESEYRHFGTTTDIYVEQSGYFGSSQVFVELKRNLSSKAELDRLVGQIESLEPKRNPIIVVLCGETKPTLLARLRERYKVSEPKTYIVYRQTQVEIVVKEHASHKRASKRSRRNTEGQEEARARIEMHKRTILATRIANNYYPELSRIRKTFLQYDLAERNSTNRQFFEKWLTDPVVEMGWSPAGGWTLERITELHADIERIKV